MVLTVEDGSIVSNADSYISLVAARAFLQSIGLSLSATDATAESQLRQAFYHMEGLSYCGSTATQEQVTQFPRKELYSNGSLIPSDSVPVAISRAQAYLASAIDGGIDLIGATKSEAQKSSQKVGQIEVSYYKNSSFSANSLPLFNNLMRGFLGLSSNYIVRA